VLFNVHYQREIMSVFEDGNIVVLTARATGKNLRIKPNKTVDGKGGNGALAKFIVERKGPVVKLKSKSTGTYLRVVNGDLKGGGIGGPFCDFLPTEVNPSNSVWSLKVKKEQGNVGILPAGTPKPAGRTGKGPHGRFQVRKVGQLPVPFPILANGNVVVLRSKANGKTLRSMPNNSINGNGGTGPLARYRVVRQGRVPEVKFQRANKPNSFLAIRNDALCHGDGGPNCLFGIHPSGTPATFSFKALGPNQRGHIGILPTGDPKAPSATGTGLHGRFSVELVQQ